MAFGNADACSTGFGYAPSPQMRLRHRLAKIHGAKVFLVDEFRTSQMCCRCHERLTEAIVSNRKRGTDGIRRYVRLKPHGLRRCLKCTNGSGAPLFCHRDVNAARNIMSCYLGEAAGRRPLAFTRGNGLPSINDLSTTTPGVVGHAVSSSQPSKRVKVT